jgi:hypothetical protein
MRIPLSPGRCEATGIYRIWWRWDKVYASDNFEEEAL